MLNRSSRYRFRFFAGIVVLVSLVAGYVVLRQSGFLEWLQDDETVVGAIERFGAAGPVLIIGLMMAAIVFSPLPSAPIALAAGAVYGHIWGTVYVAAGAEAGALIAFGIGRFLGNEVLHSSLGERVSGTFLNRFLYSQNALTAAVFVSRLMPFLSFDLISYAAGLSPLRTWRFAVATLMGIIPASFALAHFGQALTTDSSRAFGQTVLILGIVTLIPIAWKMAPARYRALIRRQLGKR